MQSSAGEFTLPYFWPETVKNLEVERVTERDRKYIVRTLSTMLLSKIPNPSLRDCCGPAEALVNKYPFLGDASEDGKDSYVSNLNCWLFYNVIHITL